MQDIDPIIDIMMKKVLWEVYPSKNVPMTDPIKNEVAKIEQKIPK